VRASKNECLIEKWACLAFPVVKSALAVILGWGVSSCIPGSGVGVDQTRPVARSALGVRLSRGRFLHRAFELGVGSEEVPLLFGAGPFQGRSFHGGAVTFNRAGRRYPCSCDSASLPFLVLLCSTAYLQAKLFSVLLPSRSPSVAQALKPRGLCGPSALWRAGCLRRCQVCSPLLVGQDA